MLTRGLIIKLIFGEKKTLANWQLNGTVKTISAIWSENKLKSLVGIKPIKKKTKSRDENVGLTSAISTYDKNEQKTETSKIDYLLREWYSKPNQIRFWDWERDRKKRTTRSNNRYVRWVCLERKNKRIYLNLTKCCSTNNKKHDISTLVIVYRSIQTNRLAGGHASKRKKEWKLHTIQNNSVRTDTNIHMKL